MPCIDLLKERFEVTDLDSGTGTALPLISMQSLIFSQTTVAYPGRCRMCTMTHSRLKTRQN